MQAWRHKPPALPPPPHTPTHMYSTSYIPLCDVRCLRLPALAFQCRLPEGGVNLGILVYYLVGPRLGVPVDVRSRSCAPMYWYVQVPVVSLCIVPPGYLRPQPHLRDLPPRAIWKLKLSAIRMDMRVYTRERVRHQLDHAVGAYISPVADHRRLFIFSFFRCGISYLS